MDPDLSRHEEVEAEYSLWSMVQNDSFGNTDKRLVQLNAVRDKRGLWRVKTKLLLRKDALDFKAPILLSENHVSTIRLLQQEHLNNSYGGIQVLRSMIRERFWILNARVVVRTVVNACQRCKRFNAKRLEAPEASLPFNRVRDATPFEIVGVDLGGPLYIKENKKSWFVVFTCAVYRAVHSELAITLPTAGFIKVLRRFTARRCRPTVIHSDNGGNFVGTDNLLKELDWVEILKNSEARQIKWIFNPPAAPW